MGAKQAKNNSKMTPFLLHSDETERHTEPRIVDLNTQCSSANIHGMTLANNIKVCHTKLGISNWIECFARLARREGKKKHEYIFVYSSSVFHSSCPQNTEINMNLRFFACFFTMHYSGAARALYQFKPKTLPNILLRDYENICSSFLFLAPAEEYSHENRNCFKRSFFTRALGCLYVVYYTVWVRHGK